MRKFFNTLLLITSVYTVSNAESNIGVLPLPVVPETLTTPSERADYIALHFWDGLDIDNAEMVNDTAMIEQAIVDFIDILPLASGDANITAAFANLIALSGSNAGFFEQIKSLCGKYLYETESPMLNEELYSLFLQSLAAHESLLNEAEILRINSTLSEIERNQPGTVINDFQVKTDAGLKTISQLALGKPAILIIYDHDCDNCSHEISEIMSDARIAKKLEADRLAIIAIDINDYEPDYMLKKEMPNFCWTSAIDDIDNELSVRSFPSLYAISPDLTVLIKDSSYSLVSQAIFH